MAKNSDNVVKKRLLTSGKAPKVKKRIVQGYPALTEAVGKTILSGTGRQRSTALVDRIRPFVPGNQYAVSPLPSQIDPAMLDDMLQYAAENGKVHFTAPGDAQLPLDIYNLGQAVTEVIAPAIDKFVSTLPPVLQQHRDAFFTSDFVLRAFNDYVFGFSPHLTDLEIAVRRNGETERVATTIPSLWYVAAMMDDVHTHETIERHAWVPFSSTWRHSVIKKNKRAGGLKQMALMALHRENKHALTVDDVARYAITRQLLESNISHAGNELDAIKTIWRYYPDRREEFEQIASHFLYNARELGKEDQLLRHFDDRPVSHPNAAGIHTLLNLERVIQEDYSHMDATEYAIAEKEIDESKRIFDMLREIASAVETHKDNIQGLLKQRSPAKRNEDVRTEGLLVRQGDHYHGFDREVNERSGYFYRLASQQQDKFIGFLTKIGAFRLPGLRRLGSHEEIVRRAETYGAMTKDAAVAPPFLGTAYNIVGTALAIKGAKRIYRNLRDGADFFTPITAVRQIGGMLIRGQWERLIEDAASEAKFPDEPATATSSVYSVTGEALRTIKPAYLELSNEQDLSLSQRERRREYMKSIDSHLGKISRTDYPEDSNNVPTLLALGMINMRLGYNWDGEKFLTMATTWAEKARALRRPATRFEVLAHYELSVFLTDDAESTKHLLQAYDIYQGLASQHKQPQSSEGHAFEEFVFTHPMNYEQRLELVKRWHGSSEHGHDSLTAAQLAYSELSTLLDNHANLQEREQLSTLQEAFKDYAHGKVPTLRAVPALPPAETPVAALPAPRSYEQALSVGGSSPDHNFMTGHLDSYFGVKK